MSIDEILQTAVNESATPVNKSVTAVCKSATLVTDLVTGPYAVQGI